MNHELSMTLFTKIIYVAGEIGGDLCGKVPKADIGGLRYYRSPEADINT